MITIVAKCTVQQDKIEAFKKYAGELAEESNREEGCISYALYQDIEHPEILTFIEKWRDQQAVDFHFQTPHFIRIVAELGKLQVGEAAVNLYKEVSKD